MYLTNIYHTIKTNPLKIFLLTVEEDYPCS